MLERKAEQYDTIAEFEAKENAFNNCSFTLGDVTNLENMYKPKSINALLYKNALYCTFMPG